MPALHLLLLRLHQCTYTDTAFTESLLQDDSAKYRAEDVPAIIRAILTPTGYVDSTAGAAEGPAGLVLDITSFYAESGGQVCTRKRAKRRCGVVLWGGVSGDGFLYACLEYIGLRASISTD